MIQNTAPHRTGAGTRRLLPISAFLATLCLPPAALSQDLSIGWIGGTNLTNDFPRTQQTFTFPNDPPVLLKKFGDNRSFINGLSVELHLTPNLSIEANALRRNLTLKQLSFDLGGAPLYANQKTVTTWEWPILLKYSLPVSQTLRPFIEAGPAFRTRHDPAPTEPSQFGGAFGAGAEFRFGRISFTSSLRYTRWRADSTFTHFPSKQDQVELLFGISYRSSPSGWNIGGRSLHFGIIGGVPFTRGIPQARPPGRINEKFGYIGGLVLEYDLNRDLSVEANGLYRPFRDTISSPTDPNYQYKFTVLTWQFPVLAKYKFLPARRIRPFVAAGPSFRLSGNTNGYRPSSLGITGEVGAETPFHSLTFGGQLRYTHWKADAPPANRYVPNSPYDQTAANQLELLFSIKF